MGGIAGRAVATATAMSASSISSTAPSLFVTIAQRLAETGLATPTRASCWKSRSGAISLPRAPSMTASAPCSMNSARSASITISARRRCRICWCCASPTCWSSRSGSRATIDHVQITVAEEIGVEGRGDYYDKSGALRDMVQNHMLQLALPGGAGIAQLDGCGRDPHREAQSAFGAAPHRRQAAPGRKPCAASTAPAWSMARRRRPMPKKSASRSTHRDIRRHQGRGRQLALGRRAVLSAHRQAHGRAPLRDRGAVQGHAGADFRRMARVRRTAWCCACSRTKACGCGSI